MDTISLAIQHQESGEWIAGANLAHTVTFGGALSPLGAACGSTLSSVLSLGSFAISWRHQLSVFKNTGNRLTPFLANDTATSGGVPVAAENRIIAWTELDVDARQLGAVTVYSMY